MNDEDNEISKSERKRQALHLQKLGGHLAEFNDNDLASLALPEKLLDAIVNYRRFPSREAKRRQLQYVGKLMRNVDVEAIQLVVDRYDNDAAAVSHHFHVLEQWRERLIDDPDALTAYLDEHPEADRQRLRQQLQRVRKARDENQQKAAARELFRLLREFSQSV
jgi:ribosome-associated protein